MQSDFEPVRDEYSISCDPDRLDLAVVYGFLSTSYWSLGLPLEVLQRAIAGSLCFGVYHGGKQVGFARVVTDRATFAYLCDVFVLDAYRGQGLGRWLMEAVAAHPDLQGLRRMVLVTRDAHGLYALSLLGVSPPRLSGVAIHKVRHRHENVQNTWIVLRTGYLVESTIKLDWIFTYQIARGLDSDRTQVFGERWTNIRKVGQEYSSGSVNLGWIHCTLVCDDFRRSRRISSYSCKRRPA